MSRKIEPIGAHPDMLQVWAVHVRADWRLREWWSCILSGGIRLLTPRRWPAVAWYSHVALRLGDTIWEAVEHGVVERKATSYDQRRYAVDAFFLNVPRYQQQDTWAIAAGLEGTPYDVLVNVRILCKQLGIPFPWGGEDTNRLNCSGLVRVAYAGGTEEPRRDLAAMCKTPAGHRWAMGEDFEAWEFAPGHMRTLERLHPAFCSRLGRVEF